MKGFLKRLFGTKANKNEEILLKKISDLQRFDDVFVILDGVTHKAWVMKKTSRLVQLFVWDLNKELIINIVNQSDQKVISFGKNDYLILNERDLCDYL